MISLLLLSLFVKADGPGPIRLNQKHVYCEDINDCPESVAMITMQKGDSQSQCTGFLVGSNILATNEHCLEGIYSNGGYCPGLTAVFPATKDKPSLQMPCKSISLRTFTMAPDRDVAYLELAGNVNRIPIDIDPSGFNDGDIADIFKVDPIIVNNGFEGKLVHAKCSIAFKPFFAPKLDTSDAPRFFFTGCHIIPGNSGSPILDEKHRARAIADATNPMGHQHIQTANVEFEFPQFGTGTNLGCFERPNNSDPVSLNCLDSESASRVVEFFDIGVNAIGRNRFKTAHDWGEFHFPMFEWNLEVTPDGSIPLPRCSRADGISEIKSKQRELYTLPVYKSKAIVDDRLKMNLSTNRVKVAGDYFIEYRPKDIFNRRSSRVKIYKKLNLLFSQTVFSGLVQPCQGSFQ